ncbi:MAG: FAD-binding protein [Rickettsiales bacterium]|jgi:electron transfer flavoprotein alpha subunit|nr:FAD-binding protein [Rickettsiales bacterium]
MSILVVAELYNGQLHSSTKHAVTAASQIGGDIHVLVVAKGSEEGAKQAASLQGVTKVLTCFEEAYCHQLAENMAPLIASIGKNYSHILMTATTTGKDILPRAAALLDVSQVSEIVQVIAPDTFLRPIYAGNALETVKTSEPVKVITVRQTAFAPAKDGGGAAIETVAAAAVSDRAAFVSLAESKSDRPELTSARVVVSGGRGMGSGENFAHLERIAAKLNAALGASRAAVDAGYVPNDWQVGQTGKVVAPDLYIAVGISGAIQHLAGMKDSKVIVAINKDENAPIFEVADYGLVAEWQTALPELEKLL